MANREGAYIQCKVCSKQVYVEPYLLKSGRKKYCSKGCLYKSGAQTKLFEVGHKDLVPSESRRLSGDKVSASLTGRYLSEAHKRKIGLAHVGKKHTREHTTKCLKRNPKSKLEIKAEALFKKMGLAFSFVGAGEFFVGDKCPDFIHYGGDKIAIEVFYRKHKEKFRNGLSAWVDERRAYFSSRGWTLLFFNETEINEVAIANGLLEVGYRL
jgi:hypothetical protein